MPVVRIARNEERPGGAANVARNAAALGAQVTLISVIGDDEAGNALERLLAAERVRTSLHRDAALPTTVKLRVIGRQQQLLRIDFETTPSHEILASKLADYERTLPDFDVVVMSDYGKGGLAHIARMIELAHAGGTPVLVDPKGEDYLRYRGATMLTPNRAEFRQVTGPWHNEAEFAMKAQTLRSELSVVALLITRAEEGMSLFTDAGALAHSAQAREVSTCPAPVTPSSQRSAWVLPRGGRPSSRPRCALPIRPQASSSASWALRSSIPTSFPDAADVAKAKPLYACTESAAARAASGRDNAPTAAPGIRWSKRSLRPRPCGFTR